MRVRNFRVTGYLPDWNHYEGPLRYDCLDAIQYAFAIPTEEGDLLPLPDPEYAHRMVREAHAHGTEFWVSVGGWSWQDVPLEATFNHIADSPERIRRLIRSAADLCREYDLDGIDMDWEYPRIQRTEGCEALYVGLADVLHSMGKKISTAVYAGADARFDGKDWLGSPVREINYGINDKTVEAMDYINIMAYDGATGLITPDTISPSEARGSGWRSAIFHRKNSCWAFRSTPGKALLTAISSPQSRMLLILMNILSMGKACTITGGIRWNAKLSMRRITWAAS